MMTCKAWSSTLNKCVFFIPCPATTAISKGYLGSECQTGGWVVGLAVRPLNFFFDLPISGEKNGLEAPHKPVSHVSC
jgi:hypothetical protein